MDVSRAHAAAIRDLLAPLPYTVYLGEVTDPDDALTFPYLVVWPPPANLPTNTLNGYDSQATTTTQITVAGTSVDEVLAALDRAAAQLHRVRPTVTGRKCAPLRQIPGAGPPQPLRDPQVRTTDGRPIYHSIALYELHSTASEEP